MKKFEVIVEVHHPEGWYEIEIPVDEDFTEWTECERTED